MTRRQALHVALLATAMAVWGFIVPLAFVAGVA